MKTIEITPENCKAFADSFAELSSQLAAKFGHRCNSVTLGRLGSLYALVWPGCGSYEAVEAATFPELLARVEEILSEKGTAKLLRKQAAELLAQAEKLSPASA